VLSSPSSITGMPRNLQRRRQRQSQRPPIATVISPASGIPGIGCAAPGQPATVSAMSRIPSIPHPMGTSASASSPNGMRNTAATAQGMTQIDVRGTAARLAATPYKAGRLKW
jgi:hypothetical protein